MDSGDASALNDINSCLSELPQNEKFLALRYAILSLLKGGESDFLWRWMDNQLIKYDKTNVCVFGIYPKCNSPKVCGACLNMLL